MNASIAELYTTATHHLDVNWGDLTRAEYCPYLSRKCVKTRKSEPNVSIGTCSIVHGAKLPAEIIICPHRFLERGQVFLDSLHLLTMHEPGNEIHRIAEVEIPGGSVDYVLASVKANKVIDFVGIELQAVDTTGSLWPARQRLLASLGVTVVEPDVASTYGVNWKMTAKTTLVQLHHKIETFQGLGKHLVLVMQEKLLAYMQREFDFSRVGDASLGQAMHFHAYDLKADGQDYRIQLLTRLSTDADGVATALGLQANPNVELDAILSALQRKISRQTLLQL